MSLINDALKKAQKAHSTENVPLPPIGQSRTVSQSMGIGQLMKIFLAAVVVLGIFGSAMAFLVMGLIGGDGEEEPTTQAPVTSVASIPTPAPEQTQQPRDVVPISKPEPSLPLPKAHPVPVPIEPVAQIAPPVKKSVEPTPAPAPVPVETKIASKPSAPQKGFALVRQTVAQGSLNADLVNEVLESEIKTPTPVATISQPQPSPAANTPQPSSPAPQVSAPVTTTPKTVSAQPAPTPAIPKPTVVAANPAPAVRSVPVARPQPTDSPSPPPAATQNPVLVDYIEKLVIQGVRMAGTNSKVLMGNRVFRLNSFVNRDLKLRLISINKERIIFIDDARVRYTKYY